MSCRLHSAFRLRGAIVMALAALTLVPPSASPFSLISRVQAATINVDSTCNINQAITSANSDTSSGSCETGSGNDTILISGSHTLTASLPVITSAITIVGSGGATIDGNSQYSLIIVRGSGNATIRNLTLTGGRSARGSALFVNAGGASATIENTVIRNNTTTANGSPLELDNGALTVRNSVIHSNTHSASNGVHAGAYTGFAGTATFENSTFYNNTMAGTHPNRSGGLLMTTTGTTFLTHVTMVGHYNSISVGENANVHIRNSLVTGTNNDCGVHSSNTLRTNIGNLFADGTCSPKVSGNPKLGTLTNGYYPLLEGSPAIDAAVSAHCLATDQRGTRRPQGKACDIGAYEAPEFEEEEEDEEPYIPPTPRPPTYTGEGFFQQTGIRVSATHGLRSGVQFKRIGAANIGLPSVLNNGFIDAVDIFGYVDQGVEVCFPRSGVLIFLDAATSPRTILPWPSTIVDNFTCGRITRPGTLVLVPLNSPLAGPVSTPQSFPAPQSQTNMTDCFLTTTHILNLRSAPGGDIIGRVNYNATLGARGRDGAWYQITVDGLSGWISADFVRTRGNCT